MSKYRISSLLLEKRLEKLRLNLGKHGSKAFIVFSPLRIFYLCGYRLLSTERPVALIVPYEDEPILFIPKLERDHVKLRTSFIKKHIVYFEYPGSIHPMKVLANELKKLGLDGKFLLVDSDGYPGIMGYRGPKLSELLKGTKIKVVPDFIDNMRLIKDEDEIKLLKISASWTDYAHSLLQEYVDIGLSETEISVRASLDASLKMMEVLGDDYDPGTSLPVIAGFRGQIGRFSSYPHMLAKNLVIKEGDVLVTGVGAKIFGYSAELERTMFVGSVPEKFIRYFNVMLRAQERALNKFGPGVKASEVNKAAFEVFKEEGIPSEYILHRVGHGIGLEVHEPPWIEEGDDTILKPGMVFSCEPGIYLNDVAGFRHSDTVVITADGVDILTKYPRDIDDLAISV